MLNNLSDAELVALVRQEASDIAFLEICRRYENIFFKVCQRYSVPLYNIGINPQDIFSEKDYIIFHCILTFKPNKKAKLGTWIGNYARYLCLNSIHARKFILPTTDDEVVQYVENNQASQNYNDGQSDAADEFEYAIMLLEKIKDRRILEIFKLRYLGNKRMIWARIAEKLGVSTQTVINLHNRGLNLLKKKLQSNTISDMI